MKIKVLLVDDHRVVCDGMRSLLEQQPDLAVVGEAHDAASALAEVERATPDVAIMDVRLNEDDGIELSRQLVARFPELRILILTAFPDASYVEAALRAGVRGYLLKANPCAEVLWAIRAVMAGKMYLCPDVATSVVANYRNPASPAGAGGAGSARPDPRLSEREVQVLKLTAEGLRTKQIAERLGIGVRTAETYRARLMRKLGCSSNVDLTRYAIRTGIATP